jgi:heat shock protein HtpX
MAMAGNGRKSAGELSIIDWLKTGALLAALMGIAGLVGHLVLGLTGLMMALLTVGFLAAAGLQVPPDWMLRVQGGRLIEPWQAPALARIVAHLSHRANIPAPRLFLLPSRAPNAMAVGGGGQKRGALGVTAGALITLDIEELEGVLAHEMAHLKNNDTRILRLAVVVSESVTTLLRVATWMALFVMLLVGPDMGYVLQLGAIALLTPFVLGWLQAAISRTRELAADTTAAVLTGKPWALARALTKISRHESRLLRLLLGGRPETPFLRTHPATKERVRRLMKMSPHLMTSESATAVA